MAKEKPTRLRHISAKDLEDIELAIESLPFRIEIKGGPVFFNKRWAVSFTIPDNVQDFRSVDL